MNDFQIDLAKWLPITKMTAPDQRDDDQTPSSNLYAPVVVPINSSESHSSGKPHFACAFTDALDGHLEAETPLSLAVKGNKSRSKKTGAVTGPATNKILFSFAGDCTHSSGHSGCEALTPDPAGGDGQSPSGDENLSEIALPSPIQSDDPIISQIVVMHRMRRRWLKARNSLIMQGKAFGRSMAGGDKVAGSKLYKSVADGTSDNLTAILVMTPFAEAASRFDDDLKKVERDLTKLAKKLPVAAFVDEVPGFGFGSLAAIVGEAGDIGAYRTVSGLWKRMGLAVIDGNRQRKVSNEEEALIHGYSPQRRSWMWNAGNGLIGGMGHGKRPLVGEDIDNRDDWTEWERMFVRRLRHEAARDPEGMGRPPAEDPKTGNMRESFSAHAAARSKRYVEKKFLIRLYAEWKRASATNVAGTIREAPMPVLIAAE